jgi:hypothetical protein
MQVSLQVALILKRIAPMRCFSLFAVVLGLGCCQNVRADSLTVAKQFDERRYGGNGLEFQADPMGNLVILDPQHVASGDFDLSYRSIDVPALPTGAVVTSATFSLIPLSGSLSIRNGVAYITGASIVQPYSVSATSLDPYGPCLPPSCAPTIATTISVAYQYEMGDNCLGFLTCFTTSASGTSDLLSLGVSADYFANGFELGTNDTPDGLFPRGATFDQVFYPGFNSQTVVNFHGVGPQLLEEVNVGYVVTPEPSAWMLVLGAALLTLVIKWKILVH